MVTDRVNSLSLVTPFLYVHFDWSGERWLSLFITRTKETLDKKMWSFKSVSLIWKNRVYASDCLQRIQDVRINQHGTKFSSQFFFSFYRNWRRFHVRVWNLLLKDTGNTHDYKSHINVFTAFRNLSFSYLFISTILYGNLVIDKCI